MTCNPVTPWAISLGLGGLVGVLAAASASVGPSGLTPLALLEADLPPEAWVILAEVRLPRVLLAVLVGAALGSSGAALQGLMRNPLADPGILGVSSSAALGAVISFYFGWSATWPFALPLGGLLGAAGGVAAIAVLSARAGSGPLSVILAGLAVSSLAGALTALALNLSPNPYAMAEIVFWLMGSLENRTVDHVRLAAPFVVVGCAALLTVGRALDALSLGEVQARSLGISVARTTWTVVAGSAAAVGAAVAVTGAVGFIGLVVPHLLRPIVGERPGRLLLPSLLAGAALVLAADIAIRLIPTGQSLRLGVVTALIGAPFFLWLVMRGAGARP